MAPLRGVIISVKGQMLVIKLASGRVIEMPKASGLNVGKKVLVTYDFTKNKPRSVMLDERHMRFVEVDIEEPAPKEVEVEEGEISDEPEDGYQILKDSGILGLSEPVSEEFWDSGFLDSGVLGLSGLLFEGSGGQDPN